MNKRALGSDQESLAAKYLEEQGMQIVERNYRNKHGEIDLIGYHKGYLVFIEVKYRSGTVAGSAAESVDWRKQRKICRVADYYRYTHGIGDNIGVRYDVVAIQREEINWIPNAFLHVYR